MKIRILRQTMAGGCVVRVGEVLEASLDDAKFLIGIGKAEQVIEEPVAKALVEEPVKSTPTPSKRRKPQ
jgi:hypothetical protein